MITGMGWIQRLSTWVRGRVSGRFDSLPADIYINSLPNLSGVSGTRVSRASALRVPAVLRGRNMICSIATLPMVQRAPDFKIVPSPLLLQFDPDVANVVHLSQTAEDLLLEGIAWWRVTARGFDRYPMSVRRVDPATVSLNPPAGRSPAPLPAGHDPRGSVVYVDGAEVPAADMIRFDSPNPGICDVGARAIRRAILLDAAAEVYAEDPRPLDYFTPTEGAEEIDDEEAVDIIRRWQAARRERATGWVPRAITYNAVQSPTPADLQLVQLQERAALEIANLMGVDPEDLGVSTTSRTYANNVDRRRDRVNDVLMPYIRALTDRLSMGDVTKRGYTVGVDLDDYLRSNPTERWSVYEKALNLGVMTVDEVRTEEGWPAGGAPAPTVPDDASALNADGTLAGFAAPRHFVADVPVTGFSVDVATRTIEGTALPYGELASKGNARFRFDKGALQWASDVGRVKLLRDHDYGQPLGRALALTSTDDGLTVRFSVARGPEGDRALELAEDGVLDGLSVGVHWDSASDDVVPDPDNDGAMLVRRADLREVSLTAMPAFDSARVSRVTASQGGDMHCAVCGQEHALGATCTPATPPPAAAPGQTYTAAQVAAMMAARVPDPGPAVVSPVGAGPGIFAVNEPAPYRFDGRGNLQRGTHDFSSDLVLASKGDPAALQRAEGFMREQFERFDVDRADLTPLNPNRNRPDMYVDQREYRYPVWDAINKGSIPDSTPFVFPKFNTSSGLVAAHTEGVEPTPGTFTATSQTVTPTAISGKVEITREAWDQGGNPQVSNLIWRQMTRAWYESLEAAAVAVLDAATPTAIALTAGGGTTGQTLDAELTAAFAALQFIRGGFSMDTMFTQVDLYKALVAAQDNDKRRLYPAIGPANATGTVRSRFAAIDVNGVLALPAWALAASGSVVASSYLFDSEVVHGWATAPQRLQFEYRVAYVDLAIWGYKATAISDTTGVREITYDPVA